MRSSSEFDKTGRPAAFGMIAPGLGRGLHNLREAQGGSPEAAVDRRRRLVDVQPLAEAIGAGACAKKEEELKAQKSCNSIVSRVC